MLLCQVTHSFFVRTAIRSKPVRTLRSSALDVIKHGPHLSWFNFPDNEIEVFSPIVEELEKRAKGEGLCSLSDHHIAANVIKTKARYFECTYLITPAMDLQLNEWLRRCPDSDGLDRRCVRALANIYETTLHRSSKDCSPLLEVHRDNVNDADLTLVVGVTPKNKYRGAFLYVSTVVKDGRVWFNKDGNPSRKSVQSVDLYNGVCAILKNNAEHYVSALQSGQRQSLVFHMKLK